MSLDEAVSSARRQGLDALCITDHGSMDIQFAEMLRGLDFTVFVGVEMTTRQGDIVAFGLNSLPPPRPEAQEFIDFVERSGGFCFAAHPFRVFGGGLGAALRQVRGLRGVEVRNGADSDRENRAALSECRALGLVAVGGSDAHRAEDVGRSATWFEDRIGSVAELVAALKSGRCRPVFREAPGSYRFAD